MSRPIFDAEILAAPCKWPCEDWTHVHDEDLPSNWGAGADLEPEGQPMFVRSSTELEVE